MGMGFELNHAIIVSASGIKLKKAHIKITKIFLNGFGMSLVSPIIAHVVNGGGSFMVSPDGSKEGWEDSDIGDDCRAQSVAYLIKHNIDFIEVAFGGDLPDEAEIINHNKR